MKNLEMFRQMVESMDGLEVNLKIGKESELIIKGDFMKIADAIGTIMDAQSQSEDARRKVKELEEKIIK